MSSSYQYSKHDTGEFSYVNDSQSNSLTESVLIWYKSEWSYLLLTYMVYETCLSGFVCRPAGSLTQRTGFTGMIDLNESSNILNFPALIYNWKQMLALLSGMFVVYLNTRML